MKDRIEFIGKCLLIEEKEERVLVVGDLHLGYEEVLNRAGIFVSRNMFEEMMVDFKQIFDRVGRIERIVLLGDVKHDFGGISKQEWSDVLELIDYLSGKCDEIIVIKGNHDSILKPILDKRGIELRESYNWRDYCFVHGDKEREVIWNKDVKTIVVGHVHPAVKLREGAKIEKFKCFLVGKFKGKKMIVIPSFIEHNIGSDPRESDEMLAWNVNLENFEVFVVPEEKEELEALDFGKLRDIRE